jgi:hypothetical protein
MKESRENVLLFQGIFLVTNGLAIRYDVYWRHRIDWAQPLLQGFAIRFEKTTQEASSGGICTSLPNAQINPKMGLVA